MIESDTNPNIHALSSEGSASNLTESTMNEGLHGDGMPFVRFWRWEYIAAAKEIRLSERAVGLFSNSQPSNNLHDFLENFHPGDRELVRQMIVRATERGIPFQIEVRILTRDDKVIWINFRGSRKPKQEVSEIELEGTIEDITARKQVEREQYRRNQVLEALSAGASTSYTLSIITRMIEDGQVYITSAFWEFDFTGSISPMVQGLGLEERYLQWAEKNNYPLESMGKDGQEMMFERVELLPFSDEIRIGLTACGVYGIALLPIFPKKTDFKGLFAVYILKKGGHFLGEMGQYRTIRNLAEMVINQKKAAAELQYRREFESLVSKISSRFVRIAPERTDLVIDEALAKIGEFSNSDRSYIFLLRGEGRFFSNLYEWCREGIEPQKQYLQELRLEEFPWSQDKLQERYVISDVNSMPDEAEKDKEFLQAQGIQSVIILPMYVGDEWIGFLGFDSVFKKRKWSEEDQSLLQFIGEIIANALKRKESYLEIQSANQSLEKKVAERTAELVHSNRSLERFAFMASHDMKEPLRMVISYLQLLKMRTRDGLGDVETEYLNFALDGGRRMTKLLEAILAYSRVNMTDRPMLPVQLSEVLENVLSNLKFFIEEVGGEVVLPDLPVLDGDGIQLEQLFQNLITNGLKFQDGNKKPVVRISVQDLGEDYQFAVSDNGIGIPDQYKDYIFEVFKRLHARDQFVGSGVGLSICKEIVRRHGGEIWLESFPGKGTTFFFTIKKKHENLEDA